MADIDVLEGDGAIIVVATVAGQNVFDFDFLAYTADTVFVTYKPNTIAQTPLVFGVDYTVAGLSQEAGGSITLAGAYAGVTEVDDQLLIFRSTRVRRLFDYQNAGDFRAETVNREFDTMIMIDQEARRDVDRAMKVPIGSGSGPLLVPGADGSVPVWQGGNLADGGPTVSEIANAEANAIQTAEDREVVEAIKDSIEFIAGIEGVATEGQAENPDLSEASNEFVMTVLRTLQAINSSLKQNGSINPYMTGAVGDGVANDRAAFQAAIDEAEDQFFTGKGGKTVIIPPGNFLLADTLERTGITAVLHSTGRAHIIGCGRASMVTPGAGVSAFANTLHVRPPETESAAGFTVANFFMGDNATGLRQGLHGIFLDTRVAGANLPKPHIHDMYIVQSRDGSDVNFGRAIAHQNDQVLNINGGMYGAVFENNRGLGGGVALLDTGDCNVIRASTISGLNNVDIGYRCAGVDATLCTSDGGAGFLVLEDLQIVAQAGAYAIYAGKDIHISRVYGEHLSADAGIPIPTGGRALAVINGLGPTIIGGSVSGGRLAAATGLSTEVTTGLYLGNAQGFRVGGGVTIYPGKAVGGFGVEMETTAVQNTIERLGYKAGIAAADAIVDRGMRNLFNGMVPAALTADFAPFGSGTAAPVVMRSDRGDVDCNGFLAVAIAPPTNKPVTTLPVGCRPLDAIFIPVWADNAGVKVTAGFQITPDGVVTYVGDATATRVGFNFSFRIAHDGVMNG